MMFALLPAWATGIAAKLILVLVLISGIVGGITYVYVSITNMAQEEQLLRDKNAQLTQTVKEQETTIKQNQETIEENNKTLEDLNSQVDIIHDDFKKIDEFLNTPEEAKKDRPASDILKDIIQKLSGEK